MFYSLRATATATTTTTTFKNKCCDAAGSKDQKAEPPPFWATGSRCQGARHGCVTALGLRHAVTPRAFSLSHHPVPVIHACDSRRSLQSCDCRGLQHLPCIFSTARRNASEGGNPFARKSTFRLAGRLPVDLYILRIDSGTRRPMMHENAMT